MTPSQRLFALVIYRAHSRHRESYTLVKIQKWTKQHCTSFARTHIVCWCHCTSISFWHLLIRFICNLQKNILLEFIIFTYRTDSNWMRFVGCVLCFHWRICCFDIISFFFSQIQYLWVTFIGSNKRNGEKQCSNRGTNST